MFFGLKIFLALLLTYIGFKFAGVGILWIREFFEAIKPGSRRDD